MVKPIVIALGAIPAIIAILIAIPLVTKPDIPFSAADPNDVIEFEYTKHQLKKIDYGVTERVGAQKTEILSIKSDGQIKYTVTEGGYPQPDLKSKIGKDQLHRLTAIVKETGFMSIPSDSFPIKDDVTDYQKSSVKVTLNGKVTHIHWPEQNATDLFVPPIVTMVESELDSIVQQIRE